MGFIFKIFEPLIDLLSKKKNPRRRTAEQHAAFAQKLKKSRSLLLYPRRHCGSRHPRFTVGSETRHGEERGAASSVRVSTTRCGVPAPFPHRQEMSVRAIKMVVHISTQPKASPARGAPTIVCCAQRNYLERQQAANAVGIPKTRAGERARGCGERPSCGHHSWKTSAAVSSHPFSCLPLNVREVSSCTWQQDAPAPYLAMSLGFVSKDVPNISAGT